MPADGTHKPREKSKAIGLRTAPGRLSSAPRLWLALWAVVGGWLLTKCNLSIAPSNPAVAAAKSKTTARTLNLQTRPIEQLRVGQRLPARNPDLTENQRHFKTAVDPATWKLLKLRVVKVWPDGTQDVHEIETLQPPAWIALHRAKLGGDVPIPLDLVEMGSPKDLTAKVLAIKRCPPIEDGPGQIILTTVNHLNRFLFRLTLVDDRGHRETLGVTGFHKFYSETRKVWVIAKDLRQGEFLGRLQRPVTVAALQRLPGIHRVYNLTVEHEHVYYVAGLGALVHNNCEATSHPSTPVGRSGSPLGNVEGNTPATIQGRPYSRHALDRMQGRGIPPSVVDNTIQHGRPFPGNTTATNGYHDPVNNVTVITNNTTGNVVRVRPGPPGRGR